MPYLATSTASVSLHSSCSASALSRSFLPASSSCCCKTKSAGRRWRHLLYSSAVSSRPSPECFSAWTEQPVLKKNKKYNKFSTFQSVITLTNGQIWTQKIKTQNGCFRILVKADSAHTASTEVYYNVRHSREFQISFCLSNLALNFPWENLSALLLHIYN